MQQAVGELGELVLGRAGVMAMTDIFLIAIGAGVVHVRHRQAIAWLAPSFVLAGILAWRTGGLGMYVFALCLGTLAMLGASYLVARERPATLKRAGLLLLGVLAFEVAGAVCGDQSGNPAWLRYAAIPLLPVVLVGFPVATMLLVESAVRRCAWVAPVISGMCLLVSWAVWIARDHYYVIKYPR